MARTSCGIIVGVIFRFCLFISNFGPIFQQRVEISTPINSWLHVQEGLYLSKKNISPYIGDTFHETPLTISLAYRLSELPDLIQKLFFILCDICTAIILGLVAEEARKSFFLKSQRNSVHIKDAQQLEIKQEENYGEFVTLAYLLNPFTIFNCVGQTTTVFGNLMIASAILSMLKGYRLVCGVALALATYQSVYPISLIFPAVLCIFEKEKSVETKSHSLYSSLVKTLLCFFIPLLATLYVSYRLTDSWDFIDSTYGFIMNVRDLKPNIGLFWYFFTEMFEHFHLLFICTFQINAFIYVIPLTIRFYDQPPLLIYSFCALMAIFKSYPCIGDVGFYLAMLPMWKHLFPFMQQKFLSGCFFIATSVLAPIQWFLWMYSGSANANFYFGVTIAFGTAQIFLLTDVFLAYIKREYYLKNGLKNKEIDGKPAGLSLM